jgi:hypothetical protein
MNFDGASPNASKFDRFLRQYNKSNEGKFTSTCEKIQNHHISIFLITLYFEFEWLFINEIEVMIALYYQCHCLVHVWILHNKLQSPLF